MGKAVRTGKGLFVFDDAELAMKAYTALKMSRVPLYLGMLDSFVSNAISPKTYEPYKNKDWSDWLVSINKNDIHFHRYSSTYATIKIDLPDDESALDDMTIAEFIEDIQSQMQDLLDDLATTNNEFHKKNARSITIMMDVSHSGMITRVKILKEETDE